jgi:hypothetical protein
MADAVNGYRRHRQSVIPHTPYFEVHGGHQTSTVLGSKHREFCAGAKSRTHAKGLSAPSHCLLAPAVFFRKDDLSVRFVEAGFAGAEVRQLIGGITP